MCIRDRSNEEGGLSIAVVDIDDMQNTIGKLREDEAEDGIMKKEEEYEVIDVYKRQAHRRCIFFRLS